MVSYLHYAIWISFTVTTKSSEREISMPLLIEHVQIEFFRGSGSIIHRSLRPTLFRSIPSHGQIISTKKGTDDWMISASQCNPVTGITLHTRYIQYMMGFRSEDT
jgi:hypothetical protein